MKTHPIPTTSRFPVGFALYAWLVALFLNSLSVASGASAESAHNGARRMIVLMSDGSVKLGAIGPYVERGTSRVQVSAKLGQPRMVLPDGSWVFSKYRLGDTGLAGYLHVTFEDNRVSELRLVPSLPVAGEPGLVAVLTSPTLPTK